MRPLLFLVVALAATPAFAQSRGPLESTAALFRGDLSDLARLATTAALVHDRTGAFPATPFALLSSPEADTTAARAFHLSAFDVMTAGDSLVMQYVPLPVAPYVRENLVVTATLRREPGGLYTVRHEMRRFEADADGGGRLLYDRAGVYEVERGYGGLCLDVTEVRRELATGRYNPLSAVVEPQQSLLGIQSSAGTPAVRVHPPGEATPVYYDDSDAMYVDGQRIVTPVAP